MLYLRLRLFPWSITCLKSMNILRPEIEEYMEHNLISVPNAGLVQVWSRVSRVVGGWAKRAEKCCNPSQIQSVFEDAVEQSY